MFVCQAVGVSEYVMLSVEWVVVMNCKTVQEWFVVMNCKTVQELDSKRAPLNTKLGPAFAAVTSG
jgi:hypothetical protein